MIFVVRAPASGNGRDTMTVPNALGTDPRVRRRVSRRAADERLDKARLLVGEVVVALRTVPAAGRTVRPCLPVHMPRDVSVRDPPRQLSRTDSMRVHPIRVVAASRSTSCAAASPRHWEHRPPQRRVPLLVHGLHNGVAGQQLDGDVRSLSEVGEDTVTADLRRPADGEDPRIAVSQPLSGRWSPRPRSHFTVRTGADSWPGRCRSRLGGLRHRPTQPGAAGRTRPGASRASAPPSGHQAGPIGWTAADPRAHRSCPSGRLRTCHAPLVPATTLRSTRSGGEVDAVEKLSPSARMSGGETREIDRVFWHSPGTRSDGG